MFSPESSLIIIKLFPQLLGIIYFFTFTPLINQILPLVGENGILPAHRFLNSLNQKMGRRCYDYLPTIFWVNTSDRFLRGSVILGTILSPLLFFGIYPAIILPILILIHLSVVSIGQDFFMFGWEGLFLETSYNALLITWTTDPNVFVWANLNFLIFRFHFQAGVCKLLYNDPTWRSMTSLCYHYETQPLPNRLSWYLHRLPTWVHRASTGLTLILELVVPFGIFGDENLRFITFILLFLLQFNIGLSGNYSYLTCITIVLITPLLSDNFLMPFFSVPEMQASSPFFVHIIVSVLAVGLFSLQIMRLVNQFYPTHRIQNFLSHFFYYHLAGSYGIFAHMTTKRYEVIVEGSQDQTEWKEYRFWYKPSELDRQPRQIAPYQPRIDWQLWFLPFRSFGQNRWFQNFLLQILNGNKEVLTLVRENPFPEAPPRYLRCKMYLYQFTTLQEKKISGQWWKRKYIEMYSPVLQKK